MTRPRPRLISPTSRLGTGRRRVVGSKSSAIWPSLASARRQDAIRAAAELNLSLSQLYKLLARYEADPKLTSLLPDRGGRAPGSRLLTPELDESSTRRSRATI